jgi:hypothetical protein
MGKPRIIKPGAHDYPVIKRDDPRYPVVKRESKKYPIRKPTFRRPEVAWRVQQSKAIKRVRENLGIR